MKNLLLVALGCVAVLLSTSCGSVAKFDYPPKNTEDLAVVSRTPIIPCRIGILPFQDLRVNENHSGGLGLYMLPFMPYGYVEDYRPEDGHHFVTISRFECNPSIDLAKGAAQSLRRSNIFGDAFCVQHGQMATAELVMTGEIQTMAYRGRIFTYGITPFLCWPLWLVGFPQGNSANHLRVKFAISRPGNPRIYWEYAYDGDDWLLHWSFYYNSGCDTEMFATLYQEALDGAMYDLRARLHRNPNLFQ